MPERKETPLELIKDFELKLKEGGFISEQNHISSISITDIKKIQSKNKTGTHAPASNRVENAKSRNGAFPTMDSKECRKWKRVPKRVWDPDLGRHIIIYVEVCAD